MNFVGNVPTIMNVVSGFFLLIGIVLLIIAYRKENYWRAGYGVEFIVLSFATLFLMHTFIDLPAPFNKFNWGLILPIVFSVYYVIKAVYLIIKTNKRGK